MEYLTTNCIFCKCEIKFPEGCSYIPVCGRCIEEYGDNLEDKIEEYIDMVRGKINE